MIVTGIRTRGAGGNCPPPPDCYISRGVGLTLWLVLALHGGLHCSSIATVVEFEYIRDCGTWYVLAPQCADIITDQLSRVNTDDNAYTADFTSYNWSYLYYRKVWLISAHAYESHIL